MAANVAITGVGMVTPLGRSAEQVLERKAEQERILKLYDLAKLSSKERLVTELSLEGYPPRQIARFIGLTVQQVYRVKYRSKAKLQAVRELADIPTAE